MQDSYNIEELIVHALPTKAVIEMYVLEEVSFTFLFSLLEKLKGSGAAAAGK